MSIFVDKVGVNGFYSDEGVMLDIVVPLPGCRIRICSTVWHVNISVLPACPGGVISEDGRPKISRLRGPGALLRSNQKWAARAKWAGPAMQGSPLAGRPGPREKPCFGSKNVAPVC